MFAQFATDHQGDQLLAVVVGHRLDADQIAVTQHSNTLRHPRQFFETMRDIDDGNAASLQSGDLLEEHFDFARREHRGRLVKDQHMAVADQVARDFNHLLMADTEFANQRVRIDRIEADLRHGFDRGLAQLLAADPASAARQIIQKEVFRHRQRRQQIEFLHDHAHAKLFGLGTAARTIVLAVELHLAGSGCDQTANDLRQGTFAGTIFAGQRQYFTAHQRQIDAGEHRLRIGLADTADREDSVRGGN